MTLGSKNHPKKFHGGACPWNLLEAYTFDTKFRKMVSIYPRSAPELPTLSGTELANKYFSKPGLGGGGGGGGAVVGHTMSHLAMVLTRLLCRHACIVLLPVILIFFYMSSLHE